MGARERRSMRRRQIVIICEDARNDSLETKHGLDPVAYEPEQLYELIMECAGWDFMSEPEQRLAVVAFDEGAAVAKASIWYK